MECSEIGKGSDAAKNQNRRNKDHFPLFSGFIFFSSIKDPN
jgi:hypothetical protein